MYPRTSRPKFSGHMSSDPSSAKALVTTTPGGWSLFYSQESQPLLKDQGTQAI